MDFCHEAFFSASFETFFRGAPATDDEKKHLFEMLRAAGFEELREFEEVDTRKVAAFNQLPDVLRAAVHKLPALVAKMVESEKSQRGRQQGIDQLENAIGVLDEHAAGVPSTTTIVAAIGRGPKRAAVDLSSRLVSDAEAAAWREGARVEALVGSAPKSSREAVSVLRTWAAFARASRLEIALPPTSDDIVAWSTLFKSVKVFRNYIAKLKLACMIYRVDVSWCEHESVKRAKDALAKRGPPPREKKFIQHDKVIKLVDLAMKERAPAMAALYLLAYAFMLRVPSEAIPMRHGGDGSDSVEGQSVVRFKQNSVVLRLESRENRPHGSELLRHCWCVSCKGTCPVHRVQDILCGVGVGEALFKGFTPSHVLKTLKRHLRQLRITEADSYRTHDFRRGHALDMQLNGKTLYQILEAGQWDSPRFLSYLDLKRLEAGAVVEAHMDEESDED